MYKNDVGKPNWCLSNTLFFFCIVLVVLQPVNAMGFNRGIDSFVLNGDFFLINIYGKVIDVNDRPIVGVSISVKGRKVSCMTNEKGEFYLTGVEENSVISIKHVGYISTEFSVKSIRDNPVVRLNINVNSLEEAKITAKKSVGKTVDLKHRQHLNLGQLLEGSVPGLTLKKNIKEQEDYVGIFNGEGYIDPKRTYEEVKDDFKGYEDYLSRGLNYGFEDGIIKRVKRITNNGVVAELRGSSSFSGGSTGLLVVIDGFVQDDFPENYPMANVASVEVIKDPVECTKWGPKAAGGVILITTNGGQAGKLSVNYTANFSFSPSPDLSNSKLQLATTGDIMEYYMDAYNRKLYYFSEDDVHDVFSPVESLLRDLKLSRIKKVQFQEKWDSLSRISNRDQLRLLQQKAFSQNHNLSVSGGTKAYRFTVMGGLNTSSGSNLGNHSRNMLLDFKNNISLLKNKLRIQWQFGSSRSKVLRGIGEDAVNMEPYQLFLDPNGNYVYDYSNLVGEVKSNEAVSLGYKNFGVNLLEDARLNRNVSINRILNSRLNFNWNLVKGLDWSNSFQYTEKQSRREDFSSRESSKVRWLINKYAAPGQGNNIDFYLPDGHIMKKFSSTNKSWNLRSGLTYNTEYDGKHLINASLGTGVSSQGNKVTLDTTLYGYDMLTGRNLPVRLAKEKAIMNYFGVSVYPSALIRPGLYPAYDIRNVSFNGNVSYSYDQRYSIKGQYQVNLVPDYGNDPPYSATSNATVLGTWTIDREKFFHLSWIGSLKLSVQIGEMRVARLPVQIGAKQFPQEFWKNSSIVINSYNIAQQSGQRVRSAEGTFHLGLKEDRLQFKLGYYLSNFGEKRVNGFVRYDLSNDPFLDKVPAISGLTFDLSLQNLGPYQGLALMMKANSPDPNGNFSLVTNSNFGLLPPETLNKEAHLFVGFFKDWLTVDLRYYRKTISGLTNAGSIPADPSTGLSGRLSNSKILNKGFEMFLKTKIIEKRDFGWTATLNGAYNINQAIDVPLVRFTETANFMSAQRNGYSTDNLWSLRWAGLDEKGNPKVYNSAYKKVSEPDSSALVYSGRTRAPFNGALIQDFRYKAFFASARMMFSFGAVMRRYIPVPSKQVEKNVLIANRWRKSGDEANTDVPVMASFDLQRQFITQNSSNSILPADYVRLREVQLGYEVPSRLLKGRFINNLTLSFQVQNLALWTRNKYGVDPDAVSSNGIVEPRTPVQYVFSLNAGF